MHNVPVKIRYAQTKTKKKRLGMPIEGWEFLVDKIRMYIYLRDAF